MNGVHSALASVDRPVAPMSPELLADGAVYTPELLAQALDVMELSMSDDFRAMVGPAARAEGIATVLGRSELAMRARLIMADAQGRLGDVAALGRTAKAVNEWAYEHGDTYLVARSHRQLSIFFRRIGDAAESLTHALRCVEHTTDTMLARLRAGHYVTLALVLDVNGSYADANERFEIALRIAADDPPMTLLVLNNMAFTAYELGDRDAARTLVERVRDIERRHRIRLDGLYLDTIARVELLLGRYADVERTLRPVLDDPCGALVTEGDALPVCLVTAAEALRRRGLLDRAQAALDQAARICDARSLAGVRADVRQAQAELYADACRFREAYEEHRRYHADTEALRSAQREARARALQAVLETEEVRRDREHYRQMAQRDALTGLYNRRYVDEQLVAILDAAASGDTLVSVGLVDLDFFKRVNDTLSHEVGDVVLRQVARLLVSSVTATEETGAGAPTIVARLGGEEFVLVLPGRSPAAALRYCEAARQAVRSFDWTPITGALAVTASIGVTTVRGATTQSALLGRADRNLYTAKREGRDRVVAD